MIWTDCAEKVVIRYILVFLLGFITAVYCLAPPLQANVQPGQHMSCSIRPAVAKAAVWTFEKGISLTSGFIGRLQVLIKARSSNTPQQASQPTADP